ncbi:MAG: RidA family protein [Angelakisella sp.]|nr:RidA family protein [Angelakisella sp.]
MMKERVNTQNAPAAIGPYSQAVRVDNMLFGSGQLPIDPATGKIVEGGVAEQFAQVVKNAKAILAEVGCTLDDVVKTTVFLQDIANFGAMNEIYSANFSGEVKPARSAFQVAALPMGALVEMEFIANIK